jgi:hypothetical protein
LGPLGIAAALANVSSGDENPCLAAIEAAKKGVKVPAEERKGFVKGAAEGAGRTFKKIFGKQPEPGSAE